MTENQDEFAPNPTDSAAPSPNETAVPEASPANEVTLESCEGTAPSEISRDTSEQAEPAPEAPIESWEGTEPRELSSDTSEATAAAEVIIESCEGTEPSTPTEQAVAEAPSVVENCPACGTARKGTQAYCDDCGWMFANRPPASGNPGNANPGLRIRDRYELLDLLCEREGVQRYRGHDHATGQPVVIVRAALAPLAEAVLLEEESAATGELAEEELLPTFDAPLPVAEKVENAPTFPSIAWERSVLEQAQHPAVPAIIENFVEDGSEYLIEESPQGAVLWDAWLDPDVEQADRYGWLVQAAAGLHALHQAGAMIEGLSPDHVVVPNTRAASLADLSDLLPLPVPLGTPLRATLYTAPELIEAPQQADARAELYSFGAMLYSLEYVGHPLEEKDFAGKYQPVQITEQHPDVHPAFFRLICKSFVKDVATRFPTDEAMKEDATGFLELIRTLEACRRTFDTVRLDIASWTTTGMVRTGNEDAFSLLHATDARLDDCAEYALVLLCDGMGGYEAGEVAAALTIQSLKNYLLQQPPFAALAGKEVALTDRLDVDVCKQIVRDALRNANKEVYTAARAPGKGRRGMGCTAEVVYVDSRNLVVGHVGDSRTYHLTNGRLHQLTRDQTLVGRLVELGQLTEDEAENHPRKNELQQAIGGQPDVMPGLYHARLRRGDWILVCSDGLTNHIPTADLEKMMLREASDSADQTARRLINLVNLRGATDNATLVVIRAS